jgi:ribonuclease HII
MARQPKYDRTTFPGMPDLAVEVRVGGLGRYICGVDEAGRGPWAGPVAVAAVILDPSRAIAGLNDSKRLAPLDREALYCEICSCSYVSVVFASAARIDAMNIRAATLWAMREAVAALPVKADYVLVDGCDIPVGLTCPGEALVGGDCRSQSIAAASIVAKVSRDRLMRRIGLIYPEYGFERHMGYGVPEHASALRRFGATPVHRHSFKPIRAVNAGIAPEAEAIDGGLIVPA